MTMLDTLRQSVTITAHLDLHETTDTDESEFRPARAARDGEAWTPGYIPDGFYLVADSAEPQGPSYHALERLSTVHDPTERISRAVC